MVLNLHASQSRDCVLKIHILNAKQILNGMKNGYFSELVMDKMPLNVFKEENVYYVFIFIENSAGLAFQSFLAVKHGSDFVWFFTSLNFLECVSGNVNNVVFRKERVVSKI